MSLPIAEIAAVLPFVKKFFGGLIDLIDDDAPEQIKPVLDMISDLVDKGTDAAVAEDVQNIPGLIEEGRQIKLRLRKKLYSRLVEQFLSDKAAIGILSTWVNGIEGTPSIEDYEVLLRKIEERERADVIVAKSHPEPQ